MMIVISPQSELMLIDFSDFIYQMKFPDTIICFTIELIYHYIF